MPDVASDFYSCLVAQLYEPLAGSLVDPELFLRFVRKAGTPSLELACGAGHPMLDLVAQGCDVWGIDSSKDMLDQCREKAKARGLQVNVELQLMQELELEQQFQSCFIAGASFCLMDMLDDAQETLRRVHKHLTPTGTFLLSVFRPPLETQPGVETSKTREDGSVISVQSLAQEEFDKQQLTVTRLRYCIRRGGQIEAQVERDWKTRWYECRQLCSMLEKAGFVVESTYNFDGKKSEPQSCNFSAIARKPATLCCS
ncbi:MAG: class I SAM-dependent methyltransferase [Gammaproteobacteria bacterium]|nr:class I SAM-dependent methyltransferase [Gammaproteobacteria bacterium]